MYLGSFGGGITVATYDVASGALTAAGFFDRVADPSFLALGPSGRVLYAVDERPGGTVRALAIGADGALTALGPARSTGGDGPTHLAVHPGGRHLLTANYGSGSVAVHPIRPDGALGGRTDLVRHTGSGPDPERQEGPHAHQVLADPKGRFVLAVDLGTDTVYTYRLDAARGRLTPVSEARTAPGAGPRHLAFHPGARFAYVVGELDGTITVAAYDDCSGELSPRDAWPTLPDRAEPGGRNYPAGVVVSADGRFVYVSNRGHDSVARFAVTDGGAGLRLLDAVPCGGAYPRHIGLSPSGTLLFAGNQNTGTVTVFRVDRRTGRLTPSGAPFTAPVPVCVLPL
ncbi:lactonase family protein [Streptomyces sp. XD-27]|uniref:lactonase family protein n=1 Tax=Streptomyces sp. XD-27 TaxID=3062779 RepID=UPI0026F4295E|nr:lactonase family protein [Streptomyces sp. XD-27]WKX70118.1 lactonase family protein [Streptomyces sp. XD-27]